MAEHARDPGKRAAQRRLAEEMTTRIHGAEVCARVQDASRVLFGGSDLKAVPAEVLAVLAGEIPAATVTAAELAALGAADALVKVGLASSRGDAKRGIQGKGFSLNGDPLADADRKLSAADLLHGRWVMLQKGKRNFALLVVEG